MCLTFKDKLEWSSRVDQAFQDLKIAFTTALISIHLDFLRPFFLENDASEYVLEVVLSQNGKDKRLQPIAFHSRNFTAIKINYKNHS